MKKRDSLDAQLWKVLWELVAERLLEEGCLSAYVVDLLVEREKVASMRELGKIANQLALEAFEEGGATHYRLTGKVVPILPRIVRNVQTYRMAGSAA